MAEITTTQSFSDGDTVTATKLNNIQANASVQPDAITNRTAETTIDQANDLLLIYDASATALKKVSASNLIKAGTASDFPITGNATIGGTLGVTGISTLTGNTAVGGTLGVTGNSTLSGTLGVTGISTLTGNTAVGGTLAVTGAITATSTINGTTIPATKTLVTTVDTQTLTNKTLTTPVISFITNTGTLTLPTSTDTLVGRITTDTLTNKTLTSPVISTISNTGTITLPTSTDTLVGRATTDTLTNKTLTSPSISTPTITGQITASTSIIDVGSGQIYKDATGNVGIGTASPAVKLEVSGGSIRTINNTSGRITFNNGATEAFLGFNGLGSTVLNSGTLPLIVNTEGANPISFTPNGTERMRIDSSGNVGIGTASPAHLLEANSGSANTTVVAAMGGTVNGNFKSSDYQDNATARWTFGRDNASTGDFVFKDNTTERMRIQTITGNVGVGTASPLGKLKVTAGDVAPAASGNMNTGVVIESDYNQRALNLGANNTAGYSWINAAFANNSGVADNLVLMTGATERLRIASAGQIGIGGANYGTSGQVLTSAGVSAAPSWTTISTTPADGSITLAKLSTSATEADNVASRVAKAWVNFNGQTGAINGGDFNVSTVADNGTGNFTVNFSAALSTASFAYSVSISRIGPTTYNGEGGSCCVASTAVGSATVNFYTSFIPNKDNAYAMDVTNASFICFA